MYLWKFASASLLPMLVVIAMAVCGPKSESEPAHATAGIQAPAQAARPAARPANGDPELPRTLLNTSLPPQTGRAIRVPAGGDLQAALHSARPGDQIVLEAGASYVGNFVLPGKAGDAWITIRTSNLAGIPAEGARVDPASHAAAMPKLLSPNFDPTINASYRAGAPAHNYRLVGIEISSQPSVTQMGAICVIGESANLMKGLDQVPYDIVFDRCYIHGRPNLHSVRGIMFNVRNGAVIDSYISDIHKTNQDTQAICSWNGPGPYKIVNNHLEAAGENVMFGGADPASADMMPSDVEFKRNYVFKPLTWRSGSPTFLGTAWMVKNSFELKLGRRVLVEGNLFENCWQSGQIGIAIVIKSANQDNSAPFSVTEDVTIINNIIRHASGGVSLLGRESDGHTIEYTKRVLIRNNLFEDIDAKKWGGRGAWIEIASGPSVNGEMIGPADVRIDHNTALQSNHIIVASAYDEGAKKFGIKPGFVFTNNIVFHNEYGVFGDNGGGVGNPAIGNYFPNGLFKKNVIIGGNASRYPADNFFPATINDLKFVNPAAGDFTLSGSSPYKGKATDGKDIGCDLNAIKAAFGGSRMSPGSASGLSGASATVLIPAIAFADVGGAGRGGH